MAKPSPEYELNKEGLTLRQVILAVLSSPDVRTLLDCKILVETSDVEEQGEGNVIGRGIEFQWGRDGNVYLRLDADQEEIRDNLGS